MTTDEMQLVSAIGNDLARGDLVWSTRGRAGRWKIVIGHTMHQRCGHATTLLILDCASRIVAARPVMQAYPPEILVQFNFNVFPLQSKHELEDAASCSAIEVKLVRGHFESVAEARARVDTLEVLAAWHRDLAAIRRR